MQSLEEYIAKRKIEDGLNEFDSSQKMNNIRTCIDYIFEYFDQYLPIQGAEKRTVAENERLLKYEKTFYWLHSIVGDDDNYWNEYLLSCGDY